MARTIYLAVFTNGQRAAHWAIWIPTTGQEVVGKMLHVSGSPATGFFLEFKRNYDFRSTNRRYQVLPLAQVHDQYVVDTPGDTLITETTARDRVESTATVVPPPGRAANPFDPMIVAFVERLIADGYVTVDARVVLQNAPRVL
ncbi:uncharacterized protein BDZ99DRAFT_484552 [Mytilinidion resinicola]|uniref:Uncharacterized protein n=1 Tax=Mytilinidion resinicola TaxID=574789 RepID=A0A6A6Z5Q5_9PEZI|nr:uncharacterized protein BDZ99DRAFT_484552 [Mytilinidion resinicola]KAF2815587.1 hypothetical protein BDZ99DRAFT_484552 [Mytilinidion resinicola]